LLAFYDFPAEHLKHLRGCQDYRRRLDGHNPLPKVFPGAKFADKIAVVTLQVTNRCRLIPAATNIRR
jgi:hypothetical protein